MLCTLTVDDHTSASGMKRYMLGGEPILTRDGRAADRRSRTPPLRHRPPARRPRWASTCCWPTCRPTRPSSATSSPCPTWRSSTPSRSAPSTRPRCSTPSNERIRVMAGRPGLRQAGPDSTGEIVLTEDGQAVDGRLAGFTMSNHEQCAVELAVQVAAATGGRGHRADRSATPTPVEQLRGRARRRLHGGHPRRGRRQRARPCRRGPRDRRGRPRPRGGRPTPRPGPAGQRRRRHWRLPGRHPARLRAWSAGGQRRTRVWSTTSTVAVVTASGDGPDGHETYRVPLPAVVTVLEGGVEPRYPTVPGRMKAKKVPIEKREPSAEPVGPTRVRLLLPPPAPSDVQVLGKGPSAAPPWSTCSSSLGVLADDPRPGGDRRRGRRRGVPRDDHVRSFLSAPVAAYPIDAVVDRRRACPRASPAAGRRTACATSTTLTATRSRPSRGAAWACGESVLETTRAVVVTAAGTPARRRGAGAPGGPHRCGHGRQRDGLRQARRRSW